jgi:hypothetical protein
MTPKATYVVAVKMAFPLVLASDGIELLKHRALARIDKLIETHWDKRKEKPSADIILRALEREARLVGYDTQRDEGFSADQVRSLLHAFREDLLEIVTDDHMRRAIAGALQRRSGLLGGAIDVTPEPTDG